MMENKSVNFGLAIAFIAPGAIVLWAASEHSEALRKWFGAASESDTTVGGFLFVLLAALATGVFISGIRWAVVDKTMDKTAGLTRPQFDVKELGKPDIKNAFDFLTEQLYRYYQFYSNMFVAIIIAYAIWLFKHGWNWTSVLVGALVIVAEVVLWFSARNSLGRYFKEGERLLGTFQAETKR